MTQLTGVNISEKPAKVFGSAAGPIVIVLSVIAWLGAIGLGILAISALLNGSVVGAIVSIAGALIVGFLGFVFSTMLSVLSPGESLVLSFFGEYMGTVRKTGLVATLPFMNATKVNVRDGNFETPVAKVNDSNGNPINISAIVVWRLRDTAKAMFAVEDYHKYLRTQAEAAVRHVASLHPYDAGAPGVVEKLVDGQEPVSLLNGAETVNKELFEEIQERAAASGVEIVEVRINNLAYSVEIAQSMLQRQQASAIVSARKIIVEGALGIVEETVEHLGKDGTITENEKSRLVSNLLVVLVGESKVTPTLDVASNDH